MNHNDHVMLLENAISKDSGGIWADIGSGTGAFTLALRDLAGPDSTIYSIDRDRRSLDRQKQAFDELFPNTSIHYLTNDFTYPLDLPKLDGLIAANAIHFEKNHISIFQKLKGYLKPTGKLIIIEYNVDHGNHWVPYPYSFKTLRGIAKEAGFSDPKLLHTVPSRFLNEIYSASMSRNK